MYFNIVFTLDDGRGRLPSRMFFTALDRLGISIEKYLIPNNWKLTPSDINLYCDSILFDLLCYVKSGGAKNGDYEYARDIVGILKSWADKNYTINVI